MMPKKEQVSVETLLELLDLDRHTGKLYWKIRDTKWFRNNNGFAEKTRKMWNKKFAGNEAFTAIAKGYLRGSIFNHRYEAHRVVYAIANGQWPHDQVDHINGNRTDNRPSNLRNADRSTQARNIAIPKTNTSGAIGVSWQPDRNKWEAFIHLGQKKISLGRFNHFNDALQARMEANVRFNFHPNHGRNAA